MAKNIEIFWTKILNMQEINQINNQHLKRGGKEDDERGVQAQRDASFSPIRLNPAIQEDRSSRLNTSLRPHVKHRPFTSRAIQWHEAA